MKKIFYMVLTGLIVSIASFAQDPVVYLPLDDDLEDDSGNGYNAIDSGTVAVQFVEDAERGKVAFFDKRAYAALPYVDALKFGPGQDFSFAMWVKIDRVSGDPAIFGNKNWDSALNKGFVFYSENADEEEGQNAGVAFSDGDTDVNGSGVKTYWRAYENGAPNIIDGTWHSFAASFDRDDTLRIWIDGELQYSPCDLYDMLSYAYDNDNNYPIFIMEDGTGTYNEDSDMKGYIDEIKIWNRTISEEDLTDYGADGNTDDALVYLPLDDDLEDDSGNGYNAIDSGTVAVQFVEDAERGKVAFFDKRAYAALPYVDALKFGPGQDFSFAMWVKIDRVSGDPAIFGNKNWDSALNKGFVFYSENADEEEGQNAGVAFSDGDTDVNGSGVKTYWRAYENGAPNIIDGTWHSFAASFDRDDTLRIWIDGELQYSPCDLYDMMSYAYDNDNNYPIFIMEDGTGTYNEDSDMKGYIDEIKIWNRTISEEDLTDYGADGSTDDALVYLPLDDDLEDDSGNGYNAIDSGTVAVQFVEDAERGKVAFFDKRAYAALPYVDALKFGPGQDFSFAMWLKIDRVSGDPAIFGNKNWDSALNKGFVFYSENADEEEGQNAGVAFSDGDTDVNGSGVKTYWRAYENGAPNIIDGTWHSFAASFDRDDTLRIWIDGELQYSPCDLYDMMSYAYDNDNNYSIFIMEDGTGTYNEDSDMKGYIDEIKIWNRTITEDDLTDYTAIVSSVIEQTELSFETTLYPNPSSGVVNVNFAIKKEGDVRIQVYSNTGILVNETTYSAVTGQNETSFNVSGWSPGIYMVRLISESASEAVRLVVAK